MKAVPDHGMHRADEHEVNLTPLAPDLPGSLPALKVKRASRPAASNFKHVCFHKRTSRFAAQHGGTTLGTFATETEAAQAVAKHLNVKSHQLRIARSNAAPRPFRERFRILQGLYIKRGKHLLPGDLAASQKQYARKSTRTAFDEEPFLEHLCMLVKFGPVKEQLVKERFVSSLCNTPMHAFEHHHS